MYTAGALPGFIAQGEREMWTNPGPLPTDNGSTAQLLWFLTKQRLSNSKSYT